MRSLTFALSLTALALTALSPFGEIGRAAQLTTTDRAHYRDGPNARSGRATGQSLPDFRGPFLNRRVLLRRGADLSGLGRPNPKLSRACREGRFRQATDRRFVAVLKDGIYGAAIGQRPGLVDPNGLGQGGIVYVFAGQGTTNCRVYVAGAARG